MKFFLAIFSLVLIWAVFSGCGMSHESVIGKKIDPAVSSMIVEGKTTEAEVLELLGKPDNKMLNADGTKTYSYTYHKSRMTGGAFSGFKMDSEGETYQVSFDKKGIVASRAETANKGQAK